MWAEEAKRADGKDEYTAGEEGSDHEGCLIPQARATASR
ncbi:hypothetical protein COMA2_110057 [Candidatus Nitrospira nitrificans]|uniref:Uncharacterized protein n=1 Tax=Candidatus Nitrospira nitrificans TaxID=1742973 RepID=A0A0S4L7F7_9BACT|nr:hypothetical protein COMA2_110057 [Candidatus Nitrospira nitrificans]